MWLKLFVSSFAFLLCVSIPTTVIAYGEDGSYANVYHVFLNATAEDPEGDLMNITFCWGNYTAGDYRILQDFYNVTNATYGLYLPDYFCRDLLVGGVVYTVNWLEHGHHYEWFIWGNDGKNVTCIQCWFDTCEAWDLNMDKRVDYIDVSDVIMHYKERSSMPGELPSDINDDGVVNYSDISLLISHYGEMYT